MNAASIFLVVLIALVALVYIMAVKSARQSKRQRAQKSQLALELHPSYQAKVAADRADALAHERLHLDWLKAQTDTQVKLGALHLEQARFAREQETGFYSYPTTSYLVNHRTGYVISPHRDKSGETQYLPPALQLPQAPLFRQIVPEISKPMLPIAWTTEGLKRGTIEDLLSVGLIGRPARGKTTALLFYVCVLLLYGAEVWVWDLHGTMQELRGLNYFDSFRSIIDSIDSLEEDLAECDELYKQRPRRYKKPRALIIDELPALAGRYKALDRRTQNATKSPLKLARDYTLEARKWRRYTFLAGQGLPHEVIDTLTRDNLSSRLIFECAPDKAGQMDLAKAAIDQLLPLLNGADKGTHIADFSAWSTPLLADIPYTTEEDLAWVLQRISGEAGTGGNGREMSPQVISSHLLPVSTWHPHDAWGSRQVETPGNGRETSPVAISKAFPDVSSVPYETRSRIEAYLQHRNREGKPLSWSEIAQNVGLSGRKYKFFSAVCKELGYDTSKPRQ